MADQFHLVERVVDGHRGGLVLLDTHDLAGFVVVGDVAVLPVDTRGGGHGERGVEVVERGRFVQ